MRRLIFTFAILMAALVLPTAAFAQAGIAGEVKDATGAVLPGVSVEASSPVLIEKTRTAVTDSSGQYKITDLRPGTYTVAFSLAGFSSVRREGIELSGSFNALVNAELKVGTVEESITVTGESPIVDVQTARTQQVMSSEVISEIPTARNYQNLHVLVPGVTVASGSQDVGGSSGDQQIFYSAHGGQVRDSRTTINGLNVGSPQVGGGRMMYVPSVGSSQETSISTSGGLGESETCGVVVNIVHKDGGNGFRFSAFGAGATEGMSSKNYSDDLAARGLKVPNNNKNVYDWEGTVGGPIKKDGLWFFGQTRYHGNANYIAGMYNNANAGNPNAWTYVPTSTQSQSDSHWVDGSLRLTWQATPRNKFGFYYEDQLRCVTCVAGGSATQSPEAASKGASHPNGLDQVTWASPVNNKMLLEAGFSLQPLRYGASTFDINSDPGLIPVTAQNGSIPGLVYHGPNSNQMRKNWLAVYATRASITYTTGAHSMKFGYNGTFYNQDSAADFADACKCSYRFTTPDAGGAANQFTTFAYPFDYWTHAYQGGLYAQDRYTMTKLTLSGGIRYDRYTTNYPEESIGPVLNVPVLQTFPAHDGARLNDFSPRGAVAYDLKGNGKFALKMSIGKYMVAQDTNGSPIGPSAGASLSRLTSSVARSWTDSNGNFVVDCDVRNQAAQNLSASGGDVCGAGNTGFGSPNLNTTFDPAIYGGWGVRPFDYEFSGGFQGEVAPRVAVSAMYFRRWFGNFLVTQNLNRPPSAYTTALLPIPADARLPNGLQSVLIQDVNADVFSLPAQNLVTAASNFGNEWQHWNGADFATNVRLGAVLMQGGVSIGRQSSDNCEIVAKVPSVFNSGDLVVPAAPNTGNAPSQFCHVVEPLQSQVKLLGSYRVPKVDILVSATLQNIPGQVQAANWAVPNATVAPLLGRSLSGGAATITVNLEPPSTYYEDRVNQLDMRVAKVLRMNNKRLQVGVDLFNAFNSNAVQTFNNSYTPTGVWQVPTLIVPARLIRISAQVDF